MTARLLMCCALFACGTALSRPLLIEAPEQLPFIWNYVAHAGNELITVQVEFRSGGGIDYLANLYRRSSSGQWLLDRTLVSEFSGTNQYVQRPSVVMSASIAAIAMPSGLRILERTSAGWTESPLDVTPRPTGQPLVLHGNTLLATEGGCATRALELNRAANGHWVLSGTLPAAPGTCVTALALDDNAAIVRSQVDFDNPPSVRILERSAGGWVVASNLTPHENVPGYFAQVVAIHDGLALLSGLERGAHVYRRGPTGWVETGHFDNPDGGEAEADGSIQITDEFVLRTGGNLSRNSASVFIYRQSAGQTFEHVANLVGTRETPVSLAFLSGRRVIALTGDFGNQPLEFNLPASLAIPPLAQDDFESGVAAQWSPLPGSRFAITANGATHVYRQSSLAGDAGAVHEADLTNQSIGADIRLNAVNGGDRWVGLMTRYTDEGNFYYVTLRNSNRLVLKRMLNGEFTELMSMPLSFSVGRRYHLRLESSGSLHAVDVDGVRVIRVYDTAFSHGHTGLRMYKAAADFDNVVVSPGPTSNLVYADRQTSGGRWSGTSTDFAQNSSDGDARRTTGVPREDQVVQAMVHVRSFASTGSPWVGLIARYQDADNYYYVTVRRSNQLSLRKLTNGSISVLKTVPMDVPPSAAFVLRLEAIGDRLRVLVDGVVRLEIAGAEVVPGKVGVATYRATAGFGHYTAYEP